MPIPESSREPLEKFFHYSPERIRVLTAALTKTKPRFRIENFAQDVTKKAQIDSSEFSELLTTLTGMYLAIEQSGIDIEDFLQAVVDEMIGDKLIEVDQNWEVPKKALFEIFATPNAFVISAKAVDIMTAHQRQFTTVRTFTDLRPIYGPDVSKRPVAALILHKLQVNYLENGESKQIFFALDRHDLLKFQDVLERALQKGQTLQSTLKDSVMFLEDQP